MKYFRLLKNAWDYNLRKFSLIQAMIVISYIFLLPLAVEIGFILGIIKYGFNYILLILIIVWGVFFYFWSNYLLKKYEKLK